MPKNFLPMTDELYAYCVRHQLREPAAARALREETERLRMSAMASPPEQSQLVALLAQLIGARRCIEVGAFTGYTTLWLALATAPDARIVCCDVTEKWLSVGRPFWERAQVVDKIDVRIAPAAETLDALLKHGGSNLYDLIFIDADKESYPGYYEQAVQLVRPGGLVLVDNVLWGGSVVNPQNQSADARAVRELNERILRDQRVSISMLHTGDGLTIAMRHR